MGDWRTDDDDDEDDDDRLERETKLSQRSPSRAHQGNHQRIVTRNHDDDDDDDDERAPERVGQTLLYFWGDQGGVDAPRSGEESGGASVRW